MTATTSGTPPPVAAGLAAAPAETPFRRFLSDFKESKLAVFGFFMFVVILFIALAAPWISPTNPYDLAQIDILENRLPPGSKAYTAGPTGWARTVRGGTC